MQKPKKKKNPSYMVKLHRLAAKIEMEPARSSFSCNKHKKDNEKFDCAR